MFAKIDKKVLIILIVALVIIAACGFLVSKYIINGEKTQTPDDENGDTTPQIEIEAGGANGGGGLSICMDKCGDGICQTSDPDCKEGSLNCICPENPQECSQDCK